MASKQVLFADAESSYEEAEFVILGVPFDGTCSFRKGTRLAPDKIREESYNFESYLFEQDIDLEDVPFCDSGDINCTSLKDMMGGVGNEVKKIIESKKFPILMGGEHSLTPPAVSNFSDVGVMILDAHLDFRDQYLGETNSHACAARRVAELVGTENVLILGVRSMERKEMEDADAADLRYIEAYKLRDQGMKRILKDLLWKRIYLSIDMDFIDPAYAPGVGNPEPFGFSPMDVKECINAIGSRLVGFDICEVSPPYDTGNTASLAARIVREAIAEVWNATINKDWDRFYGRGL